MTFPMKKLTIIDFIIIVLSFYALGALLFDTIFKLDPEMSALLCYIDTGICAVFLLDFLIRFKRASDKLAFMKWGWIDLISSIPAVGVLRFGRVFRLIRLLRIVKSFKSINGLLNYVFRNRAEGTFMSVISLSILFVIFSAISILQFETAPESNILTAEDAIWWAFTTVTSVGYGDVYPVTSEGRVIGIALMTVGVGLFGTFTAYVASWFVSPGRQESHDPAV